MKSTLRKIAKHLSLNYRGRCVWKIGRSYYLGDYSDVPDEIVYIHFDCNSCDNELEYIQAIKIYLNPLYR